MGFHVGFGMVEACDHTGHLRTEGTNLVEIVYRGYIMGMCMWVYIGVYVGVYI